MAAIDVSDTGETARGSTAGAAPGATGLDKIETFRTVDLISQG